MFKFSKIKKKISNKELRNLDYTIIDWLVPRLKAFKEQTTDYPYDSTYKEWVTIIDKIIKGLNAYKAERPWDKNIPMQENLDQDKVFYAQANSDFKEAMRLLTEHFSSLWY
nr:MAG TPA: hypothetical protein [Bacteriophage sp.]